MEIEFKYLKTPNFRRLPAVICQNQSTGADSITEYCLYTEFIESHLYSNNYNNIYFFPMAETFKQFI